MCSYLSQLDDFYLVFTSELFINPYESLRNLYKWTGFTQNEKKIAEISKHIYNADKKYFST